MKEIFLKEQNYKEKMAKVVEPYLAARQQEMWFERESGKKIYCVSYHAKKPKGVLMISHGFHESVEKYKELIYYFVKAGYHVYMPEHCGHGRSYRLVEDLSLVHVDSYKRYVEDFLFVAENAKKENPNLKMFLFGHSMGGGIVAAVAAKEPDLFQKVVLSSPMIRPATGKIPWHDAKTIAAAFCTAGQQERYVAGQHSYRGPGKFETSTSVSRARHEYYQEKKDKEPLLQMNGASYGWLYEAARLNHDLQKNGWKHIKIPVLLFQPEHDHLVSKKEQIRFLLKLNQNGNTYAKLVRVPGTKHTIWSSNENILRGYFGMIFQFLNK